MKKFDERPLDEKFRIILEDNDVERSQSWHKVIKVKFLVISPLISFVLAGIIFNSNKSVNDLFLMIFFCIFIIIIGVFLYSIMNR